MKTVFSSHFAETLDFRPRNGHCVAAVGQKLVPAGLTALPDHRPERCTTRIPAQERLREHDQVCPC